MIQIIGYGVVGKAVHKQLIDQEIKIFDPYLFKHELVFDADVNFICVPTPTKKGKQDISHIIELFNKFKKNESTGIFVIKSTVLPENIDNLVQAYSTLSIMTSPEFLDQNDPYKDQRHVIGVEDMYQANVYMDLYKTDNVCITTQKTAMMMKYVHNIYGATKVIFFNLMNDICTEERVDYREMLRCLFYSTSHIGSSYTNIASDGQKGFGGKCFPKDLVAFNDSYETLLLDAVKELNICYRKKEMKEVI